MKHSQLFKLPATWLLAFGLVAACGQDTGQPGFGNSYTDDGGATPDGTVAPASTDNGANSGAPSGDDGSSSTSPSSTSGSTSGSACPSSCRSNSDCSSCGAPPNGGTNCCVMSMCVPMNTCPVIRDSGHDGS